LLVLDCIVDVDEITLTKLIVVGNEAIVVFVIGKSCTVVEDDNREEL
jgi:hypothetical protein